MNQYWKQNTSFYTIFKLSLAGVFLFTVYSGYRSLEVWLRPEQGAVKGVTITNNSLKTGTVKAVEDNITENSLVFRLRTYFLEALEAASAKIDTNLEVGNNLIVGNDLTVGGITITSEGLTAPNIIYSITAGAGISILGEQDVTIVNSDLGSAQDIFKNFIVGANTISAGSNTDTLTWTAGSGVSLSNSGKTITIGANASDLNISGWVDDGTVVRLGTSTDNVGIGTTTTSAKLHVAGNSYIDGEIDLTDALRVAGDAGTSGYLLTSSAGGAMIWTDPSSLSSPAVWTNTANVLHPANATASLADLVLGGVATASADIQLFSNGSAIFNEQANDADFRIEAVGQANAFFVQGSDGNIGIGTNAPGYSFEVTGDAFFRGDIVTDRWSDSKTNIALGTEIFGLNAVDGGASDNVAIGQYSLYELTTGDTNIAIGYETMYTNTSGSYNIAMGYDALYSNETGDDNVAIGDSAMWQTVSATNNVALGSYALRRTDSGWNNVAIGTNALSGPMGYVEENIAIGRNAQTSTAMEGDENISLGSFTLDELTTADGNIAIGDSAGTTITSGDFNTIVGTYACCGAAATGSYNVLFGYATGTHLTSGSSNILIGNNVGTLLSTGSNNILIGQEVRAQSGITSNQLNIGNLIYGTGLGTGITLGTGNIGIGSTAPGQKLDVVGSARFSAVGSGAYASDLNLTADGTLTTSASDVRLKENFVELSDSEVLRKILQLRTYSFEWKKGGAFDLGMVAQEVFEIFPEITFTNKTDGYMGINYSRLPTLLVSALQEQNGQLRNLSLKLDETGTLVTQMGEVVAEGSRETQTIIPDVLSLYVLLSDTVWTFIQEVIFTVKTTFLASVEFVKDVTFRGSIKFSGDTVGKFVVPAGALRVEVPFDFAFSQAPTVYLSAQSQIIGGYSLESVSTSGFVLKFEVAQTSEKVFDWLAVLSSDENTATIKVLEESSTSLQSIDNVDQDGEVGGATTEGSTDTQEAVEETPNPEPEETTSQASSEAEASVSATNLSN